MKLKTIIVLIIIILSIFLIYFFNLDTKVYYVNISDLQFENIDPYNELIANELKKQDKSEKYINDFSDKDYRTTDLIRDIEQNKTITINNKEQTLQNALIKADILTLKIGDNELNYKIDTTEISELFDYCDTLINDLEELFKIIRKYCKEDIYFIGFYSNHSDYYDEIYNYINLKIEDIAQDYEVEFIKTENLKESKEHINIYNNILKIND